MLRTSRTRGLLGTVLSVATAVSLALPGGAIALPTTVLTLDPTSPDGVPPWYVSSPEVVATPDQSGTLHWWWDDGAVTTTIVTTSTPVSLGFMPEGPHIIQAFTVSAEGTESVPATASAQVDSIPPTQPQGLSGSPESGDVVLDWDASTDSGSGVDGYYVYRNEDGLVYSVGDRIAFVASGDTFTDTDDLGGAARWYAVSARDEAGNEGLLTAATRLGVAARVWGTDRFATSLAASRAGFADGTVSTVVMASGLAYPDALAASGLAGLVGSPVMLVGAGPIDQAVKDELTRLGAADAYVIGGDAAVAADTFASIQAHISGDVTRLGGDDRYDTAGVVEAEIRSLAGGAPPRAYVVSGLTFPDALSAGPAAFAEGAPVLYATPDGLPQATLDALAASGATRTVIVGGTPAVWSGAEGVLPGAQRIEGANRYETSREFAEWAIGAGLLDGRGLVVATGDDFPDGLSAAGYGGTIAAPVALTSEADVARLATWIAADAARFDTVTLVGGSAALSDAVLATVSGSLTLP